jgi:hypothetical protein
MTFGNMRANGVQTLAAFFAMVTDFYSSGLN